MDCYLHLTSRAFRIKIARTMFPVHLQFKKLEKKTEKEMKLAWVLEAMFTFMHFICVLLFGVSAFFTGMSNTDVKLWTMSLHCNNPIFNQIMTPVDRTWPLLTILVVSVVVLFLLSIDVFVGGSKSAYLRNTMSYGLGFILCWNVTFVLQTLVSYPKPFFFKEAALDCLYCNRSCSDADELMLTIRQLIRLDMDSRCSFPSYIMCACSYASVFLFEMFRHLDKTERFAAKLVAFLAPASVTAIYGWYFWQQHENHPEDIISGILIGGFVAYHVTRDLFHVEKKPEEIADDFTAVLMSKELAMLAAANNLGTLNTEETVPTYTVNLDTYEANREEEAAAPGNDDPPTYSSLL